MTEGWPEVDGDGGDVDRIILYRDAKHLYRWRFRAAGNGEVMADSGQGYRTRDAAKEGAARVTGRTLTTRDTKSAGPEEIRLVDRT